MAGQVTALMTRGAMFRDQIDCYWEIGEQPMKLSEASILTNPVELRAIAKGDLCRY
jgi:hypothetical protein